MKTQPYIKLYNFEGFNSTEDVLMSLIVSLHENKKQICFSNHYASLRCKVSVGTISRTLNSFSKNGFVKLNFTTNGRVIELLNTPNYLEFNVDCDIAERVEDVSNPLAINARPLALNANSLITDANPLASDANNIRVDIKEDIKESRVVVGLYGNHHDYPSDFLSFVEEYKDDAKITVTQRSTGEPDGINFENKAGDFKNDYRFMLANVVTDKLKADKFKGVKWGVEIAPAVASIQRLRFMAQANSEETTFVAKVESGALKFYFGDHSSHSGNFVFQHDVAGALTKAWNWPVGAVISILSLAGDKSLKFSDEGAAMITVDSGIATYNYILPAQQK